MASTDEIVYDCKFFKKFKDGRIRVHRPLREKVPTVHDPEAQVRSKDVGISPEIGLSARIFLPKSAIPNKKLPLLFYVHGGGFCMLSPFHSQYDKFCTLVADQAQSIVVSVDYGLFPARPIPACYDDSWEALQWVAQHANGSGPDRWLNEHADFDRVFIGGDSAGGNITHTLVFRAGSIGLSGAKIVGAVLVHPFFGGTEDDEIWMNMCPTHKGPNDPRMNPPLEDVVGLECQKVLIFVAEKDHLMEPGKNYYEKLKRSGWKGKVEIEENIGEEHCFHFGDFEYEKAKELVTKFASFIKEK